MNEVAQNKTNLIRRHPILISIISLMLVAGYWFHSEWSDGKFMQFKGSLIISSPVNPGGWGRPLESRFVKKLSLDKPSEEEQFFQDNAYDNIHISQMNGVSDLYSARKLVGGKYTVLSVEKGTIKELMKSDAPIFYPAIRNQGTEIIFFSREPDEKWLYYLYRFDMQKNVVSKISEIPVVWWSKPMFSSNGDIYFAAIGKYVMAGNEAGLRENPTIKRISSNGEVQDVVKGLYPVWLDEGKTFFCFDRSAQILFLQDLTTGAKKAIARETIVYSHPTLSPDKKISCF